MSTAKIPVTFGAWVQARRKQLDLTQSELGKRAGCSEAAVRKIEADERKPSLQLAGLLARALEIPSSEKESFLKFSRGALIDEIRIKTKLHPHNLPALVTSTIDRTHDLASVTVLLKDKSVHLITLLGPPGIGKTRLSIHCGNEALDGFPDGVWFVDLSDVSNADFFVPTITRFLPTLSLPPSPNLSSLIGELKGKSILLILDNLEQIVETASLDVAQILKACPEVKILVTSRMPLHIYGEHEYPLPPLSIPPRNVKKEQAVLMQFESVQLFSARTRQHQPKFTITKENADAIVEICSILDGIPLAIELAAASLRQMTINEMVALLRGKDWVKQIAATARDLPQRQQTLENVIEWSYNLLTDQQKVFFKTLGIFSKWFDAEAASATCDIDPSESRKLLNALTNHSLLVSETIKGKTHWRMLELIHKFADLKLMEEERWQAEFRRANYFLTTFQNIKQDAPHQTLDEYFQVNINNFHSALKWMIANCKIELGLQLACEIESAWSSLGYFKEGLDLTSQLIELSSDTDPRLRAKSLQVASDLAWQQHDFETAMTFSEQAVELGRIHGMKKEYPWYLNRLGRMYIEQGKLEKAQETLNKALQLAQDDPDLLNPGSPLAQLGEVALFEGRLKEARSLFEQALTHLKPKDDIFLAISKTDLAEIALAEGDSAKALFWLKEAFGSVHQQVRRLMVFLSALAGYVALFQTSHRVEAAEFYGAIDALTEHSGVTLGGFYQRINQERVQMTRAQLPHRKWQDAFETGRSLERDELMERVKKQLGL